MDPSLFLPLLFPEPISRAVAPIFLVISAIMIALAVDMRLNVLPPPGVSYIFFFGGWALFLEQIVIGYVDFGIEVAVIMGLVVYLWVVLGKNNPIRTIKMPHGFGTVNVIHEWEKEHPDSQTTIQIEELNAKLVKTREA